MFTFKKYFGPNLVLRNQNIKDFPYNLVYFLKIQETMICSLIVHSVDNKIQWETSILFQFVEPYFATKLSRCASYATHSANKFCPPPKLFYRIWTNLKTHSESYVELDVSKIHVYCIQFYVLSNSITFQTGFKLEQIRVNFKQCAL